MIAIRPSVRDDIAAVFACRVLARIVIYDNQFMLVAHCVLAP
ncbi:MAG TPA: hypothetical protein VN859_00385 [Steroidobacteraceae bacterium]|nr:hypothetical protein [Steroidobacteraceae bacterium]